MRRATHPACNDLTILQKVTVNAATYDVLEWRPKTKRIGHDLSVATSHVQDRDRKLRFTRSNTKHLECYRRLGVFCKMHGDRTRFVVHVYMYMCMCMSGPRDTVIVRLSTIRRRFREVTRHWNWNVRENFKLRSWSLRCKIITLEDHLLKLNCVSRLRLRKDANTQGLSGSIGIPSSCYIKLRRNSLFATRVSSLLSSQVFVWILPFIENPLSKERKKIVFNSVAMDNYNGSSVTILAVTLKYSTFLWLNFYFDRAQKNIKRESSRPN